MSTVTIRVDEETKAQVNAIVEDFGLDLSTTVRAFFRQIIREKRIPLNLSYDVPNDDTIAAMREAQAIATGARQPRFPTADEMFTSLGM